MRFRDDRNFKIKRNIWATLLLVEGTCVFSWIGLILIDDPFEIDFGDIIFIEGGLFLLVGGIFDLTGSITFSHVLAIHKSEFFAPPPEVKKTSRSYTFFISGVLLCVQGGVVSYITSKIID